MRKFASLGKINRRNPLLYIYLFLVLFLRIIYGASTNFSHEDYAQIYLIGLKFYTTGIWPYWGPDITMTVSQIPGALQGLLVGIPFFIVKSPIAPFILVNCISTFALAFFAWYLGKRFSNIPKWFIWIWVFIAPWFIGYSTTTINPSYILPAAIFFFISIFEIYPFYKHKLLSLNLAYFLLGSSIMWVMQLHMSWVLLPFYVPFAFYFSYKQLGLKRTLGKTLYFLLGILFIGALLIPTFIKFGIISGGMESNIVFNSKNARRFFDILLRFSAFSSFETQYFLKGNLSEEISFLKSNLWAAPFIAFVFITGLLQSLYFIASFFIKNKHPEYKTVTYFTVASFLLVYLSYLFAIRSVSSHTFYVLSPVAVWFSFYYIERLLKKRFWRNYSILFLFSGIVFHIALAINYSPLHGLKTQSSKINEAILKKDSRIYGQRRVATWEKIERQKLWIKNTQSKDSISYIEFSTDFDLFDPYISPENVYMNENDQGYYCKIDSVYDTSTLFSIPVKSVGNFQQIQVSFNAMGKSPIDHVLVFDIKNNGQQQFWNGIKIPAQSLNMNSWSRIELQQMLPKNLTPGSILSIYIWLPSKNTALKVDDFTIKFYK